MEVIQNENQDFCCTADDVAEVCGAYYGGVLIGHDYK